MNYAAKSQRGRERFDTTKQDLNIKRNMNLSTFFAEHLTKIMNIQEYEEVSHVIKERIEHLSFLMNLVCDVEDFQHFYREYTTVTDQMNMLGQENNFKLLEMTLLDKTKKLKPEAECKVKLKEEDEGNGVIPVSLDDSNQNENAIVRATVIQITPKLKSPKLKRKRSDRGKKIKKNKFPREKYQDVDWKTPLQCPDCGKVYTNKYCLEIHQKIVHRQEKHQCDQCDYKASTKGHLKTHFDNVHLGIKHTCAICGFSFTDKANLRCHSKKAHKVKI